MSQTIKTLLLCLTAAGCTFLLRPDPDLFTENNQKNCSDDTDNDGDGLIDERDPECLFCGDGAIGLSEQCDDLNQHPEDGCNALCQIEPGFVCNGEPSDCFTICGDGIKGGAESCDDSNTTTGDGCDANCVTEFCGDHLLALTEECDDGNTTSDDGCEADCTLICSSGSGAFRAAKDPNTGNCLLSFITPRPWLAAEDDCEQRGGHLVTIDSPEENFIAVRAATLDKEPWIGFTDINNEAGADPLLFVKVTGGNLTFPNFAKGEPNNQGEEDCVQFFFSINWNDEPCDKELEYICELEANPCGDGVRQTVDFLSEGCDDGNPDNGDGCDVNCRVEAGFGCVSVSPAVGQPSQCSPICGDTLKVGAEECDDGNTVDGDGCSAVCKLES